MTALLSRIRSDRSGIASLEIALAMPVLLILLSGTIETVNFIRVSDKVQAVSFATADLLSQQQTLSTSRVNDVFRATELMMQPFDASGLRIGVAAVRFRAGDGQATLDWTESRNGGVVDAPLALTAQLTAPGQSVIVVTAEYTYRPIFGTLILSGLALKETAFAQPRRANVIERN
ncbi:MAG: TadE/TadG family type IV pilus assembly protein [Sphingomonadales bacterium]